VGFGKGYKQNNTGCKVENRHLRPTKHRRGPFNHSRLIGIGREGGRARHAKNEHGVSHRQKRFTFGGKRLSISEKGLGGMQRINPTSGSYKTATISSQKKYEGQAMYGNRKTAGQYTDHNSFLRCGARANENPTGDSTSPGSTPHTEGKKKLTKFFISHQTRGPRGSSKRKGKEV